MNKDTLDKKDIIIAGTSGFLTAAMDCLWVRDISFEKAHKWGKEEIEKFVMKIAEYKGYKGDSLSGSIAYLEKQAPIYADELTKDFGGGRQHHLRDFSHHPTPIGLIFSLLNEFTGYGFGTDTSGKLIWKPIPNWKKKGFFESIYSGTITWGLHMISDIAGSGGTVGKGGEGTGIPGPFLSMIKEMSAIPAIRKLTGDDSKGNNNFSVICSKLFNGTLLGEHDDNGKIIKDKIVLFDFRTELGIGHEILETKQYLPVLLCDAIVCAFYSIRRLFDEIRNIGITTLEQVKELDFSKFLPWKSKALKHMRTISSISFSTVDISVAALKSYVKNKNDKRLFAIDIAKSINYIGVGRVALSLTGEMAICFENLHEKYKKVYDNVLEKTPEDVTVVAEKTVSTVKTVVDIGTPIGVVSATLGLYKDISSAIEEYKFAQEERIKIEAECRKAIDVLNEYQDDIENIVSEYMTDKLLVFGRALDKMDDSINNDDTNGFIEGNNEIQKKLGRESAFESQEEFDLLMMDGDNFKL